MRNPVSTASLQDTSPGDFPVSRRNRAVPRSFSPDDGISRYQFWVRAIQVISVATPFILAFWRDTRTWFLFGGPLNRTEAQHRRRAKRIRDRIEMLGVSFIKVGQVVSTRGDLLPKAYLDELSTLQDSITPLDFPRVRKALEDTYGAPLESIFEMFEETPIATASIGQVHCARYQGKKVVVKLVRPGIRELITLDFRLTVAILSFLDRNLDRVQGGRSDIHVVTRLFNQIATEVNSGLTEEMDFAREQANAERLRELLGDHPEVVIPRTIPDLCRPNVLVMEFVEGVKISDAEVLRAWGFEPLHLVDKLVELYVEMVLVHGVYHADPHPGNVFVNPLGKLVLFDFGIVRTLSKEIRDGLVAMTLAGLRADIPAVVDELYKMGVLDPAADRETALQVGQYFAAVHFQGLPTAERIEILGKHMRDAFGFVPLRMPQEMVYVFRVTSMLEGLGTRFKPGWNMMADGGPAVRRAVGQALMKNASVNWFDLLRILASRVWKSLFGSA